jgi:CRISPR/Cas system-associated exonuclease Cas4 (RecB family)
VTSSDLADYAYCPRSFWYRKHPPAGGPTRRSRAAQVDGERFHARTLTRRFRRERRSGLGWVLVGGGLLLCLLAVLVVVGR